MVCQIIADRSQGCTQLTASTFAPIRMFHKKLEILQHLAVSFVHNNHLCPALAC